MIDLFGCKYRQKNNNLQELSTKNRTLIFVNIFTMVKNPLFIAKRYSCCNFASRNTINKDNVYEKQILQPFVGMCEWIDAALRGGVV
jgi:hypothetical protein